MQRIPTVASSVRTGIVLLILVGITSAAGTLILQRPLTEPEELQRAYSPATLRWLDALGLTDVFHSWWFVALLSLLCINIVLTSLERLPTAWRYFSRPYRKPERHFLAGLPMQQEIPIPDERRGMEAAERAFRKLGLQPQRIGKNDEISLYAERHRVARLAAYVVHASLLLILGGGIVDALWGYRGFVALTLDQQSNQIELRDGTSKVLPFTVRCEGAGQENYADGSPRRWWSKLAVVEDGREVLRKEIEVNEPLVYRSLRFFQASYGPTGQVGAVKLTARSKSNPSAAKEIVLALDQSAELDAENSVRLAAFIPDFVLRGNQVESRSDQPNNPAIQLVLEPAQAGKPVPPDPVKVWLFPKFPGFSHANASPYTFEFRDVQMGYFTGLQVAYEPGQWAVWTGSILMGLGLGMAFYLVHLRFWAVPVSDGRGRLVLWVGASASKNRDELEARFRKLVDHIEKALANESAVRELSAPAVSKTRELAHSGSHSKTQAISLWYRT